MTATSALSATESHESVNPFPDLPAIRGFDAGPEPSHPRAPASRRFPSSRFGDYSRTRFESRVAFGGPDEGEVQDAEDQSIIATPTRQFSLLETTSGLPDDSREADERAAERRLRDLRWRVKAARAAISTTPGAEELLRQDWVKAAHFYACFGITEVLFRHGMPAEAAAATEDLCDQTRALADVREEIRATKEAIRPGNGVSEPTLHLIP